jgi:hypothetical protein
MAITHPPMVIMVLGRGVRVTGVMVGGVIMVDGDIMVIGVRVTGGTGGIADNTLFAFSRNQAADPNCQNDESFLTTPFHHGGGI